MSQVVTWQSSRGGKMAICEACEERYDELGTWPKDSTGEEFAKVYKGAHTGGCESPIHGLEKDRERIIQHFHSLDLEQGGDTETRLWAQCQEEISSAETLEELGSARERWSAVYAALESAPSSESDTIIEEVVGGIGLEGAVFRARARAAGRTLRDARQELGWTLDRMAAQLDVDRSTVHRWETGALPPNSPGMLMLAVRQLRKGG